MYLLMFTIFSSNRFNILHKGDIIVVGDFNVPTYADSLISGVKYGIVSHLNNFLMLLNLVQYNQVRNVNDKILDLVLSNSHCSVRKSLNPLFIEDIHQPTLEINFTDIRLKSPDSFNKSSYNSYNFRKADLNVLYN